MNTAEKIKVMQAYEDGKQIEYKSPRSDGWGDASTPVWDWYNKTYRIKEQKKVVDLSVLIGSQIDCEFRLSGNDGYWAVAKLSKIHVSETPHGYSSMTTYHTDYRGLASQCRPRMNHPHAWQGGECPLPEGVLVKVWYRRMGFAHISSSDYIDDWRHDGDYDTNIIAFEVIGLADGYCWPWEVE